MAWGVSPRTGVKAVIQSRRKRVTPGLFRRPGKEIACLTLALFCLLGLNSSQVHAHALSGDCHFRAGKLHIEGYYSDETAAAFADVRIVDAKNKTVIEGKLDGKGHWQIASPAPGSYTVIIETDGHGKRLPIHVPADGNYSGRISTGLTRAQFTAFPWANVTIGLATIAIFALAIFFARMGRRKIQE